MYAANPMEWLATWITSYWLKMLPKSDETVVVMKTTSVTMLDWSDWIYHPKHTMTDTYIWHWDFDQWQIHYIIDYETDDLILPTARVPIRNNLILPTKVIDGIPTNEKTINVEFDTLM